MKPNETRRAIEILFERRKRYIERQEVEIQRLKQACEHDWTYQPDPSGNNDSGYSCSCGSWRRRRP